MVRDQSKVRTPKAKVTKSEAKVLNKSCNDTVKSDVNEKTFVSASKVGEAVRALKIVQDEYRQRALEKKPLFDEDINFVYLTFSLKKIPLNYSTYIHSIALPHHWRHTLNFETCLIVKDLYREPLSDRDADLEETKSHYRELLESKSVSGSLINEILPMRQLRNEFRAPELRKKLAGEYNRFLCDKNLLRNKHAFLSRFLGKAFWIDRRKVPILVKLDEPDLKEQIEEKLNHTTLYVSGKGSTVTVCVGSLEQPIEHVEANTLAVLEKLKDLFGNNVRELAVKTEKSMAILFYMDLGSANEVILVQKDHQQDRFVEDEFDFLTGSNVRVYRDGSIRIVPKGKVKETEASEEVDESDNEEPDVDETEFVRQINRREEDNPWTRKKVTSISRRFKRPRPFTNGPTGKKPRVHN